jgi:STE20-like kinase
MEHETMKLKEQEEAYSRELKEWKGQLKPRKQVNRDVSYILFWDQ